MELLSCKYIGGVFSWVHLLKSIEKWDPPDSLLEKLGRRSLELLSTEILLISLGAQDKGVMQWANADGFCCPFVFGSHAHVSHPASLRMCFPVHITSAAADGRRQTAVPPHMLQILDPLYYIRSNEAKRVGSILYMSNILLELHR